MNKILNLDNQLAQVCNNLYGILQSVRLYSVGFLDIVNELDKVIRELEAEYDTLFKLIYYGK